MATDARVETAATDARPRARDGSVHAHAKAAPVRRILRSFGFAAQGIVYLFRTQPNFWVHTLAAVLVVVFAIWLGTTTAETGVLLLAIGMVLAAEAFNTAVEAVVDLVTDRYHPLARIAKDTAAAGVLLSALGAVVVGAALFLPPLASRAGF